MKISKQSLKWLMVTAISMTLLACGTPNYQQGMSNQQAAAAAKRRADSNGMYRVKSGDTLVLIARANSVTPEAIMSWNSLSNPNQIEVGWRLRVRPVAARVTNVYQPSRVQPSVIVQPYPQVYTQPYSAQAAQPLVYNTPYAPYAQSSGVNNNTVYNPNPNGYSRPATPINPIPQGQQVRPSTPVPVVTSTSPPATNGTIRWIWPVSNPATKKADAGSKGLSFTGAMGTPVLAAAGGEVLYAGNSLRGYGKMIVIKHSEVWSSVYANNNDLLVKQGDVVSQGQTIAKMGHTDASKTQMYFEIRWNARPIDPLKVLPQRVLR